MLGAGVALNPCSQPHISLEMGLAAYALEWGMVLMLSLSPVLARVGVLLSGLFLAVPCFLWAKPLPRALLMCGMALPFVLAAVSLFAPEGTGFRGRTAYFFSWMGRRQIKRRASCFDGGALWHLCGGIAMFVAGLMCVQMISPAGWWWPARWLAGGMMIFGFAEVATASHDWLTGLMGMTAPALMRSPVLSTSISEFWSKRWNVAASALAFGPLGFKPFVGGGYVGGLFMAFLMSAVAHVLLAYMATGRWGISLVCGAFFMVQPLLILAERGLMVRHWRRGWRRVWALGALALTAPLFVEPALQVALGSWGGEVFWPTVLVVAGALGLNLFFLAGQKIFCLDGGREAGVGIAGLDANYENLRRGRNIDGK